MKHRLLPVVLLCAVSTLAGCQSDLATFNERVDELDVAIAEGKRNAELLPPGPERDKWLAGVEQAESVKTEYARNVAARSDDPNELDEAAAASGTASGFVPPPWNVALVGLTTLLGTLAEYKRRRLKQAAGKVVKAIETAKDENGVINFSDPATRSTLRSSMGSDGQALVEKVR